MFVCFFAPNVQFLIKYIDYACSLFSMATDEPKKKKRIHINPENHIWQTETIRRQGGGGGVLVFPFRLKGLRCNSAKHSGVCSS